MLSQQATEYSVVGYSLLLASLFLPINCSTTARTRSGSTVVLQHGPLGRSFNTPITGMGNTSAIPLAKSRSQAIATIALAALPLPSFVLKYLQ